MSNIATCYHTLKGRGLLNCFKKSFHGTIDVYAYSILENIDIKKGRYFTDFGQGFYVTSSYDQAKEWAMKKYRDHLNSISEPKPAIVQLWLDVEAFSRYVKSGLIFERPDDKWSEFIYNCRKYGRKNAMYHSHDFVCGSLADGKIVPLMNKVERNEISLLEFKRHILPRGNIVNQLSLHTEEALAYVLHKEVHIIKTFKISS